MTAATPMAVITFETPRQALSAEQVLRRARIDHQEVPPPEKAGNACGVALRIPLDALYEAIGVMATDHADWEAVYQLDEEHEVIAKLG